LLFLKKGRERKGEESSAGPRGKGGVEIFLGEEKKKKERVPREKGEKKICVLKEHEERGGKGFNPEEGEKVPWPDSWHDSQMRRRKKENHDLFVERGGGGENEGEVRRRGR